MSDINKTIQRREREILNNWFERNKYLGIKRIVLESLSKEKKIYQVI